MIKIMNHLKSNWGSNCCQKYCNISVKHLRRRTAYEQKLGWMIKCNWNRIYSTQSIIIYFDAHSVSPNPNSPPHAIWLIYFILHVFFRAMLVKASLMDFFLNIHHLYVVFFFFVLLREINFVFAFMDLHVHSTVNFS